MSDTAIMVPDELPILMKSGLVHWIKIPTWEKISNALATQEGHQFIRIAELGNIVINTSQVEGAYTMQQFDDHCKVKEGQWQCSYRVWHLKKGECQCKSDYFRKQREAEKKRQDDQDNKPQTPEEREASRVAFLLSDERAALNGYKDSIWRQRYVKGSRSGKMIRRSTITAWEKETGRTADVSDLAIEETA